MKKRIACFLFGIFLVCGQNIFAQTMEEWKELQSRCEEYRTQRPWPAGWSSFGDGRWVKDMELLKKHALSGKKEAFHELFLQTQVTDGFLTDVLGEALAQVRDQNEKLYYKRLKKEPKAIRERVDFHTAVARGEPGD